MNLQNLGVETLGILWRANWQAGVLALTVLVLRFFLDRRLDAKWRCRLWMLVMLRLMLPAIPSSPWSLFNLFHAPEPAASVSREIELPATIVFVNASENAPHITPIPVQEEINWYAILIMVWLSGVLLFGLRFALTNIRFARRIRGSTATLSSEMIELFRSCARELHIARIPDLVTSTAISTPSLYGLFRRRLLMPSDYCANLSTADARLVFLHELTHVRRNDLPATWIAALLQIIHWFNPLVWIATKTWRADMESACDAAVLAMTGPPEHTRYGLILLQLATRSVVPSPLPALGIIGGRMQLSRRIIAISRFHRPAARWSITGAIILGLTLLLGLTDARGGLPTTAPSDLVTRIYKITDLITTTRPSQTSHSPATDEVLDILSTMPMYRITPEEIADWTRQSIAPGAGNQNVRIDLVGDSLTVTAPIQTQKAVAELLKSRRVQIEIKAQFLTPNASVLASLTGSAIQKTSTRDEPLKMFTADEVARLIRTASKVSHAPRVTIWDSQSCEMYQITYIPYVAGVQSQKANGKLITVPIVQEAKDGIAMAFQPRMTSDKKFVTLALVVKQFNMFGFTTVNDPLGKHAVSWQRPIQFDTEVVATVQIPVGLSYLVPLRKDDYAIVTPKIITQ